MGFRDILVNSFNKQWFHLLLIIVSDWTMIPWIWKRWKTSERQQTILNKKLHQTFNSRMLSNNTIQDIFDITAVINCHAMNRFVINAMSQSDWEWKSTAPQTRPLIPLTNKVVLCSGPRACLLASQRRTDANLSKSLLLPSRKNSCHCCYYYNS